MRTMHVERVAFNLDLPPVEIFFQLRARQMIRSIGEQNMQQAKLNRRQREVFALLRHRLMHHIEFKIAPAQLMARLALLAAQQYAQPRDPFS